MVEPLLEHESDELRALRRGLRDLVALTTLPAIWAGSQHQEIAQSLADVLITTVHLDMVYICLKNRPGATQLELLRANGRSLTGDVAEQAGKIFAPLFKANTSTTPVNISDPLGSGMLKVIVNPIGYDEAEGYIVAGLRAPQLFTEIDHLLLRVAANQAVTALRQTKLLTDVRALNLLKDDLLIQEQSARAKERQAAERLALLQELTSNLSQSSTFEQIAKVIMQTSSKLFPVDQGIVYRLPEGSEMLLMLDGYHLNEEQDKQYRQIPLNFPSPLSDAIRNQTLIWADASTFSKNYVELEPLFRSFGVLTVIAVPFTQEERILGGLVLSFTSPREENEGDVQLLLAIGQQCAQAIERAQLSQQAAIMAAVEERQRLARDLHDAVSQVLFAATTIAEGLPARWERNPSAGAEQLEQVAMLNRAAMGEMRTLLLELLPEAIVNSTLDRLLLQLVQAARGRREIEAELVVEGEEFVLPPDVLVGLYRIAQESINNVVKHSRATRFHVRLHQSAEENILEIHDNGRGFDIKQPSSGFGMESMRDRAAKIKAELTITSAIDQGTCVRVAWKNGSEQTRPNPSEENSAPSP